MQRVLLHHALSISVDSVDTETDKFGCEPVVDSPMRRQLVWLMAEFFKTLGYTDLKARLPGFVPPVVLSGTLEDHRPDITCRQSNSGRTPTLLEAVPVDEMDDPRMEHRWTLLSSAAKLYGAELHFVVPKWSAIGAGDQLLRRRLERLDISHHRIWVV